MAMVQSAMARAVRGMLRLPTARPRFYAYPALNRVQRTNPWLERRIRRAHGLAATGGADSDGDLVDDSAVHGRRDPVPFVWNPILLDPLPVRVPIPMRISVPHHQATSADGYVFVLEATCDCRCELFAPVAAAHIRDVIVGAAQQAARAEMTQGGWTYRAINLGLQRERYAERVMERMASSPGPSSILVQYSNYSVTAMRLEPVATLATAATQPQEPVASRMAVSIAELFRQINTGTRLSSTALKERVIVSSKAATSFMNICITSQPAPPPRSWICSLFTAALSVAILLPVCIFTYATLFPDAWSVQKDAAIEAYAKSFKYHSSWGLSGESLVQRKERMIAEQQRRQEEERRRKLNEELRKQREEERMEEAEQRKKQREEDEARRRAEAYAESTMTLWQRFLYRANAGDRRFRRYRRP